jgi:hypothetical protein
MAYLPWTPLLPSMFEMAISRKWSRWNWTVSDHTGKVVAFGWEFSRREAAYKAARERAGLSETSVLL